MSWYLDPAVTPPPPALTADPLTPNEIDALPEAARVWATVLALREAHEHVCDAYEDRLAAADAQ